MYPLEAVNKYYIVMKGLRAKSGIHEGITMACVVDKADQFSVYCEPKVVTEVY